MNPITPKLGTTYQSVFGVVINSLRAAREPAVTQADLASHLGLTVSTWSRIERGESAISLDQMVSVAMFFEIPLSELLQRCEHVILELEHNGVDVAVSKGALAAAAGTMPLTNTQILGMTAVLAGPLGWAAAGALEVYRLLKSKNRN